MYFALGRTFASVGDFELVVSEWNWENSLEGEREEREGNVKEK